MGLYMAKDYSLTEYTTYIWFRLSALPTDTGDDMRLMHFGTQACSCTLDDRGRVECEADAGGRIRFDATLYANRWYLFSMRAKSSYSDVIIGDILNGVVAMDTEN